MDAEADNLDQTVGSSPAGRPAVFTAPLAEKLSALPSAERMQTCISSTLMDKPDRLRDADFGTPADVVMEGAQHRKAWNSSLPSTAAVFTDFCGTQRRPFKYLQHLREWKSGDDDPGQSHPPTSLSRPAASSAPRPCIN